MSKFKIIETNNKWSVESGNGDFEIIIIFILKQVFAIDAFFAHRSDKTDSNTRQWSASYSE